MRKIGRVVLVCVAFVTMLTIASLCAAQTQADEADSVSMPRSARKNMATQDPQPAPAGTLGAQEIIDVLQQNPAVLPEIRQEVVNRMQQQGRTVDESQINDDMIFDRIRSDSRLRQQLTGWLQDHGYLDGRDLTADDDVSSDDSQSARLSSEERQQDLKTLRGGRARDDESATGTSGDGRDDDARDGRTRRADRTDDRDDRDGVNADRPERQTSTRRGSQPAGLNTKTNDRQRNLRTDRDDRANSTDDRTGKKRDTSQTIIERRPSPYANVPALYDLYSQVSPRTPKLERFGNDIFKNGTGNSESLPIDMPVGPDYVVGPGDGLSVELWGSVSERLQRVVDREGRIALPEVGSVLVAGRPLGEVQNLVQTVLRTQYREVQADVSLSRLRSVRVYVVGDVERPGAYDISSLSTPLNAMFVAGGPTERGSLRTIRHYRGDKLVQELDVYDLVLHGIRSDVKRLEPGDSVLVPPIGAQVTVEGMVRRPAIYEVRGDASLANTLGMAGGVLNTGTLRHIEVERVQAHEKRTMLNLDLPETNDEGAINKVLADFKVQDGDRVRVSPILPYSEKTVYLDGHVFHPGKYPYHDGMKVSDLVKSYNDLLPEPFASHAEVIRLEAPDYRPTVLAFNLTSALEHTAGDIALQPFDTVRVFGRYDFEDSPRVTVRGEVRKPGSYRTNGETHLSNAIYLAGGVTQDTLMDQVQVYRQLRNSQMQVLSANLGSALAGEKSQDLLLQPKDVVIVHRNLAKVDPPKVYVWGEVAKPGQYPLGDGMTAAELVNLAGGLRRSAYTASADLSRNIVNNGAKLVGDHREVLIAKALAGDGEADVALRDGDVLTIRQIEGWKDFGASIAVQGDVVHEGTYGIREGERLSSVLKRAGGFRTGAYPQGAVLERVQVREISEKSKAALMRRIEEEGAHVNVAAEDGGDKAQMLQAMAQQRQQALNNLRNQAASGRLVIRISPDMKKWANTPADIEVRAGDTIYIPKKPNFVVVNGQVYNPSAISYVPGKNAGWYLRQAGGPTDMANKNAVFVIRADGSVASNGAGGWWKGSVLDTVLQPGDTIVVPDKVFGPSGWKNLVQTANLVSSLAIAARVATSF